MVAIVKAEPTRSESPAAQPAVRALRNPGSRPWTRSHRPLERERRLTDAYEQVASVVARVAEALGAPTQPRLAPRRRT